MVRPICIILISIESCLYLVSFSHTPSFHFSFNISCCHAKQTGATTVTVANPTSDGDNVMMNAITAALTDQFGSIQSLADHVMYCLPPGTMTGIAYAYVGGQISVYSDNWYVCKTCWYCMTFYSWPLHCLI